MIIYIDENMPEELAEGLNILQKQLNKKYHTEIEVKSIKRVFGQGAKDEEWIPIAGDQGACIITQDSKIQRIKHQSELCKKYKLGLFFLNQPSGKGLTYWQMVELCVQRWESILEIALREERPFCYRHTARKGFTKLSL
ncbi:PIN-like domain-containing protein [Hymenobacter roseosalivarius]|uniref:PIN-like domain-containing protein n=1 Tax=Hymenobacter roseosalivarius TaxID=89967 RepID=UPI0009FF8A2C|nr:hypothetical protein [Hymenobacter roseosalivarius]